MVDTLNRATNLELTDVLRDLVVEQRQKLQTGEFPNESIDTGEALLDWFKGTDRFREIYQQAVDYLHEHITDERYEEFEKHFIGRLYQELAFAYLALKETSGVLLSPERTLIFYQELYPDADRLEHIFGLDSLEGISVPDGLLIDEVWGVEHISEVWEYGLNCNSGYRGKKHREFQDNSEHQSGILDSATLLFIRPRKILQRNSPGEEFTPSEFDFDYLPFTYRQFVDFFRDIHDNYRLDGDPDCATLAEIRTLTLKQSEGPRAYAPQLIPAGSLV